MLAVRRSFSTQQHLLFVTRQRIPTAELAAVLLIRRTGVAYRTTASAGFVIGDCRRFHNNDTKQVVREVEAQREGASAYSPTPNETRKPTIVSRAAAAASSFLAKIKLILLGQANPRRKWKFDDLLALFSWLAVGNGLFILLGTTTATSLFLVLANSLQFQEYLAQKISDYLTRETGFNISFESAIAPFWKNGSIRMENVSIVCNGDTWTQLCREMAAAQKSEFDASKLDLNFTHWDLKVQIVDVRLSLWRWLEGRGLVEACSLQGVRGVVDRRHIAWSDDWKPVRKRPDLRIGSADFEIDGFHVEDLLVTILNPAFRPYSMSVFNASLPRLRRQWLMYDIMSADNITGMFDNCLFSVHKPLTRDFFVRNADNISAGQSSALSPSSLADASTSTASLNTSTTAADDGTWTKMSHLKINGVPIDHINAGTQGPFSWITKGTLDIDMHFLTPNDNNQNSDLMDMLREEIEDIRDLALDKIEEVILTHPHEMVDARRVARREEEVRRLLQVFEEEKAATAAADANSAAMKTNGSLAKTKSSSSSSSGSTAATTTASTSSAPAKLIEPSRSTPIDDLEVLPLPRSFKLDCYGVQYPFADEAPQPLVISSDLNNLSTSSPPSSPSSTSSYQDPNSNIPQSKTLDTSISSSTLPSPSSSQNINNSNNIPTVVMFWNVKMNNLKVSVPLAPPELSYMSSAMIRPVVAYLNANRNTTPISFSAEMSLENFNGSWTVYESGLAHILSSEIGQAVARHVSDDRERSRRLRAIGLWSLTSVTRNLVTLVDYVSGVRGWSHFYASPWMLESQPYLSYGTSSLVDEDRK